MNAPTDSVLDADEDASRASRASRAAGGIGRVLLVAIVLAAAAVALHLTPIRSYLADADQFRGKLMAMGAWVYPATIAMVAVLLACGVPRLPIHAAGGMIFGFSMGLTLTIAGAILGLYAVFLLIRWGGRDWVLNRWPKTRKWADAIDHHGVIGVVLIRQLPAHSMLINLCLALSNVKHRHFLIGTALGLLPEAIPATLIGAGLMQTSLKGSTGYLALAAAAFAIIWISGGYTLRSLRKHSKELA